MPNEHLFVRDAAVLELVHGWKDHPDTLPLLKACVMEGYDDWERQAVLGELAREWKDDPEVQQLVQQLKHPLGDDEHKDELEEQLSDEAPTKKGDE